MNLFIRSLSSIFTLCCVSLGLVLICVMFKMAAQDSTMFPFWDQWAFTMQMAGQHGHYSLAQLWEQHNEHRIVLLRLLLLADFNWFGATGHLLLGISLIGQLVHLGIFCRIIYWLDEINSAIRLALCGIVSAFFFSPGQLENFVWSWQVCFILASLFASICFYLFVKTLNASPSLVRSKVKWGLFVWSLIAAFLATLSVASGLFVWPVLVCLCLVLRLDRRVLAAAALASAVVMGSYLFNYHSPPAHASPLNSIQHPLQMLQYLLVYLGGEWAVTFGIHAAMAVGLLGLLIAIGLLLSTTFRAHSINRSELFCSAIVALTLLTGFVTASGRINFGIDQAFSSRYQTFTMVFWSALTVWTVSIVARSGMREWRSLVVALGSFIILGTPLLKFHVITNPYKERAGQWRLAEASVLSGVKDLFSLKTVSPNPTETEPALDYLRTHRLSVFTGDRYGQIGASFLSFYQVNKGLICEGNMKLLSLIRRVDGSGTRLSGWAWEAGSQSTFQNLVLVNQQGKIAGFGAGGFLYAGKRPDKVTDDETQWFGYVKEGTGTAKVQAYGVMGDGRETCPVGEPQTVAPSSFEASLTSVRLLANTHNGVFRAGQWWLDVNGDGQWTPGVDATRTFGQAGDVPVVGDWDGAGKLRIGVFRGGQWFMDMNGNDRWDPGIDRQITLGQPGDIPIVGDWDETGKLRIGVFRNGQWWLDMNGDGKWDQDHDVMIIFGQAGDIPVIGDWDGSSKLRIGVFRNGQWWLDMDGDNKWTADRDALVNFGQRGDQPVIGNWDHSGKLRIGVFHNGHWLLDLNGNNAWDGPNVDEDVSFGKAGDLTSLFQWPVGSQAK